jgi:hypothetical protein
VVVSDDLGGRQQVGDQVIESYPSSTFRFLGHREGDPWLAMDLDRFAEPLLLLQSG